MTMITASTAMTIFIMNIHHCGPDAKPVPPWAIRFILIYLARICFVYDVGESCLPTHTNKSAQKETSCALNGRARGEDLALRESAGGWTDSNCVGIDPGEMGGATAGCGGKAGESGMGGNKREMLLEGQCKCHYQTLLRNVEYIANYYYDQKATQRRNGEWRKVAKVMDRFFMWIFFIMVFLMSLLIIGKAV
ncbi:Neuronal acetylcholine receptor subunit alpha-10 [Triplophysa tibetana]|uniref:Neuronal acetylcholine receptor subunit alpha-10 n=1 Tax=Triplophysa tibetana TaxID=1572043 RepID=A0A5A9PH40_9TELE|nr:Neuronal acetylcholine receptor subunit alpha-10 [Triplophysa tibetana]